MNIVVVQLKQLYKPRKAHMGPGPYDIVQHLTTPMKKKRKKKNL